MRALTAADLVVQNGANCITGSVAVTDKALQLPASAGNRVVEPRKDND